MAEAVTLDFIAAQLRLVLDSQRGLRDEQRALREEIRTVVREEIRPRVREMEEDCEYPRDLYELMAERRLLGLGFPPEHGGRCSSEVSWCAYVEELAKVSTTVSLMAAYVKLVSLPILLAGSEEQKKEWLPGLVSGEKLGSYALTEPAVGSDPAALQTTAERRGDVYVLNGEKRFIGNAGLSDLYVVFARTGKEGAGGISAFVVDGKAPGLSAEPLRTMGMPGWKLGAPKFEDVEVPHENLLDRYATVTDDGKYESPIENKTRRFFTTIGTLSAIWAGVWYYYLRTQQVPSESVRYFICTGLFLSGIALVVIGQVVGRIGRQAKEADLPPTTGAVIRR